MKDQELIKELRNQNRKAFEILIDEFQQKVFHSCLPFVPNKEDAEEITQEVFLEVYKSLNGFKAHSKLSTWIYKITTNKCLEFIRRKNTKKRFGYKQSIDNSDGRLRVNGGNVRRLNLTNAEKQALVDFMKTLTDNSFITDERWSDPFKTN